MNNGIGKLAQVAEKTKKWIVGLMAGTSLDGLDIALCEISSVDFNTEVQVREFHTVPYPQRLRQPLRSIAFREQINQRRLCKLHRELGSWYGRQVKHSLRQWNVSAGQIDMVASHGQTTYHLPAGSNSDGSATLQLGDADHLACQSGIITFGDFRQKFIAAGGEGAPLTPFVDRLIFSTDQEARLLLNIGGIANYTWLDRRSSKESAVDFIYSDTGPGNTLINEAVRHYYPEYDYDPGGRFSSGVEVHEKLLDRLMKHPFLQKQPPKSTGPESFGLDWVFQIMKESNISEPDAEIILSTLTQFTVETIARSVEHLGRGRLSNTQMYVSGGGVHNQTLLQRLRQRLSEVSISSFDELGIDPDAREAMLFAVLANQSLSGEGVPIAADAEVPLVRPGKISIP